MAKAPTEIESAKTTEKSGEGEFITYLAGEGDPPQTKWRGIVFHANVPKMIVNQDMIAAARGNKGYHVGPFDPDTDRLKTEYEQRPKNAEQYRTHAVSWFPKMRTLDEFDSKWLAEETLRQDCGVGTDDIDYLMHLIGPRRAELKRAGLPAV